MTKDEAFNMIKRIDKALDDVNSLIEKLPECETEEYKLLSSIFDVLEDCIPAHERIL